MAKKAAYVVFVGRKPGVYGTWEECCAQVTGYRGAEFRGYVRRSEAENAFKFGNGPNGGSGYVHATGITCGHHHGHQTRKTDLVTCPACLRAMKAGATASPPHPRKAKAEKMAPAAWRLWNLKTATWASDKTHPESDGAVKEKIERVGACDPRVKDFARTALFVCREDDTATRERRQTGFDIVHADIATKRLQPA